MNCPLCVSIQYLASSLWSVDLLATGLIIEASYFVHVDADEILGQHGLYFLNGSRFSFSL